MKSIIKTKRSNIKKSSKGLKYQSYNNSETGYTEQKLDQDKIKSQKARMSLPVNNNAFAMLRNTLINNMKSREKPEQTSTPSEPIILNKSDKMKNMIEEMNKRKMQAASTIDEPIQVIVGSGGPGVPPPPPPPPPPPMGKTSIKISQNEAPKETIIESNLDDIPKIGVPPPPPPPPPPIFDPSKVIKKPKKPVVKKEPPKPAPSTSSGPSMKDELMKMMKKMGK